MEAATQAHLRDALWLVVDARCGLRCAQRLDRAAPKPLSNPAMHFVLVAGYSTLKITRLFS